MADTVPFSQKVMGFDTVVNIPKTIEGLAEWAGGMDVVWKAAIKQILYHGYSPNVRESFAEELEKRFPDFPRPQAKDDAGNLKFKKVKDDDGNEVEEPVLVTEQEYWNAVFAAGLMSQDEGAALAREIGAVTDAKPRVTSGRKPNKDCYSAADKILAAVGAGTMTAEQFIATFEGLTGVSFASLGEFNRDNVAMAVKINEENKKKSVGAEFGL